MPAEHVNHAWKVKVHRLLRQGYGVEDIADKLTCDVSHVRLEVQILREEGRLIEVLGV